MIVSTKDLAEVFDVAERTVRHWSTEGLPKVGHNQYDLNSALRWWQDNIKNSNDTSDIQTAKGEYWQAKARREKVAADLAEGKVAPTEDYIEAWSWRISEMRNGLLQLPLRLSQLVAGKSELETRKTLENEIWHILDKYSRIGKWTPDNQAAREIRSRETTGTSKTDTGSE